MKPWVANLILLFAVVIIVIAQLLVKWQVNHAGPIPSGVRAIALHFAVLLSNPWVVLAYTLVFLAALAWMAALSQLDLSYAYPILSLTYVGVVILSSVLFGETLTVAKLTGVGMIVAGVFVMRVG